MLKLENKILEFPSDAIPHIRKNYNLDKPGEMDKAIDILDAWVKKQTHFVKKDFTRDYLETAIIVSKGSVERAKSKIDKNCTLRTVLPHFFQIHDIPKDFPEYFFKVGYIAGLPKLTAEYYRVLFAKLNEVPPEMDVMYFYRYLIAACEYVRAKTYLMGVITVVDYSDINLMDIITKVNLTELRQFFTLYMEAYGLGMKGIHIITTSKVIGTLVGMLKQVLNEKLGKRIFVHKTKDSLKDYIDENILPIEYGGKEKSLKILHQLFYEECSKTEYIEYLKDMNQAGIDENLRPIEKLNAEYMGISGTFRTLSVD